MGARTRGRPKLTAMILGLSSAAMVPRVAGVLSSLPPTASRPAWTPRSSVTLQYGGYDAQAGYEPSVQGYGDQQQQGYGYQQDYGAQQQGYGAPVVWSITESFGVRGFSLFTPDPYATAGSNPRLADPSCGLPPRSAAQVSD